MKSTFTSEYRLPFSAQSVFEWHLRPGAFERLTPPGANIRCVDGGDESLQDGVVRKLELSMGPLRLPWVAGHQDFIQSKDQYSFTDFQVEGPFKAWKHIHAFQTDGPDSCWVRDTVVWEAPFGPLGATISSFFTEGALKKMLAFREDRLRSDLQFHQKYSKMPLKVGITGASGMIGSSLSAFLRTGGHEVFPWVRGKATGPQEILWNPETQETDDLKIQELDVIVHLAGENISEGRWDEAKKKRILDSRVQGTQTVVAALKRQKQKTGKCAALISASAVGIYPMDPEIAFNENSPLGDHFLAKVCQRWEAEAQKATQLETPVTILRFGMVLSGAGGALAKLLPIFRLGGGGPIASGEQWMSWIAIDDLTGLILYVATNKTKGVLNAVSPKPVTNLEFSKILGEVMHRPSLIHVPGFALKLAFGRELAEEVLMASQKVYPKETLKTGFEFGKGDLRQALRLEI